MGFDPKNLEPFVAKKYIIPGKDISVDPIARTIFDVSDCPRDTSEEIAQAVREKLTEHHQDLLIRAATQIKLGQMTGVHTGRSTNIYQIAEELITALVGPNSQTQKED